VLHDMVQRIDVVRPRDASFVTLCDVGGKSVRKRRETLRSLRSGGIVYHLDWEQKQSSNERGGTGSAGPEVDRTGVTLSVGLKVKIYRIRMVGYIGITVTSPREPWVMLHVTPIPSLETSPP